MTILTLNQIIETLPGIDLVAAMEQAFCVYSRGLTVVPPVGELRFENPPGDVHIKYGYIAGGEHYVIKVASGFYDNPSLGLPSSNGLMLLFRQDTGRLECVLLDEGHLTDIRTAAAGAVCTKHLGPEKIERIGIVGTGTQARLQLELLTQVTPCRTASVWGRTTVKAEELAAHAATLGFDVAVASSPAALAARCNLIVTTTPSREPLLQAGDIRPGTHITAVGSDTNEKQELDPGILALADRVVADSIAQCRERGEIARALLTGVIDETCVVELGAVIDGQARGRADADGVTVADLTGVAVQDIAIAECVYQRAQQH